MLDILHTEAMQQQPVQSLSLIDMLKTLTPLEPEPERESRQEGIEQEGIELKAVESKIEAIVTKDDFDDTVTNTVTTTAASSTPTDSLINAYDIDGSPIDTTSLPNFISLSDLSKTLPTIYWDVDDVIINALSTIVDLINRHYNLPQFKSPKTINDVRDWALRSINRSLTSEQLLELFASAEFFNEVKVNQDFLRYISPTILTGYNNVFLTKGTVKNIQYKETFLRFYLPESVVTKFAYVGISLTLNKSDFIREVMPNFVSPDLSQAIIIDDNLNHLSDCSSKMIKILLKNNRETNYNQTLGSYAKQVPENLYIANDLREVFEVLHFNFQYPINGF